MIRKCSFLVIPFLALLSVFTACSRRGGIVGAQGEFAIGTYCQIDLFEEGRPDLYNRLFTRLAELDSIFSANRDDSELSKINQNAGRKAVEISPELYTVLERALYFAQATEGAFDPTVGPLVKLWGIGTENARIPPDEEIQAALALVDYRDLELKENASGRPGIAGTAFLKREGMALDLGAIAKGYAADELVKILNKENIKRAIIDLGGNIYVWGSKDNGDPWLIGIQDPLSERGNYLGVLELKGSISVVSSGVYERFLTGGDGKRYHHIMELSESGKGKRGYPSENNLLSTTVIAVSSMDADALSTSCFVLGYEKGLALAMANGAEIIFIEETNNETGTTIRGSPGAMSILK